MTQDALGIRIAHKPDTNEAIVKAVGEIDLANAHHLADALESLSECAKVVLDISELRYMDSSGLTVLIAFEKRIVQHGGQMIIAGASVQLRRLFDLSGLSMLFKLVPTVGDAAT